MPTLATDTPRLFLALASSALSLLTLGALVVLPAHFDEGFAAAASSPTTLAQQAGRTPLEVTIIPARVEVTAVREPNVAWAMGDPAQPNCKPNV